MVAFPPGTEEAVKVFYREHIRESKYCQVDFFIGRTLIVVVWL
jgi:hypothetical protein